MPTEVNIVCREKDGQYFDEPLLVTIALEEYRCLVKECARLNERVQYLENRLVEERIKTERDNSD